MKFIPSLLCSVLVFSSYAQFGCTDPQAQNFNIAASQNDGSCLYNPTNYSLQWRDSLSSLLNEISGMVYWQGKLYVHNDSGTPNHLYEIDTTHGLITKTIILGNIVPNDWARYHSGFVTFLYSGCWKQLRHSY